MKITLLMVASLDGKTTRWNEKNIHAWTSKEDQKHFMSLMKNDTLFMVGKKTFEILEKVVRLPLEKLFVVNGKPKMLIKKLDARGYKKAFLVGGEFTNTVFFREKLIDEIILTVEPKIFGNGKALLLKEKFDIDLKLLEIKRLNKKGTLLLKYKVI